MSEKNNCFKEAVCVEIQRIFDSCSDRDGIYDLPVTLNLDSDPITEEMNSVRVRSAEVEVSCIAVDNVMLKAGYYAVDITYRFSIIAEAFSNGFCQKSSGTKLCGTATWNKRVILYGGESNTKVFTSDEKLIPSVIPECCGSFCQDTALTMPKATVKVINPVALEAKFICLPVHKGCYIPDVKPCCCNMPAPADDCHPSPIFPPKPMAMFEKTLVVSLGLFSIVQLSRPVSLIVPSYDYCMPQKECVTGNTVQESANDIFERLEFPTEQFFPTPVDDGSPSNCGCFAPMPSKPTDNPDC